MSKGWILAAVIFFVLCCGVGGVVMAGLLGPEGSSRFEWKESFGGRDAGEAPAR